MHKVRDKKILDKFAQRVKEIRKAQGFTQEELAYKSGLSLSQIARIETAKLNSSVCTIVALAGALGVETTELVRF